MNPPPARVGDAPPFTIGFREFVAMMAALMAVNALGIDSMLPALPAIGRALGIVDENQRQWIISSYVIGFGATQIVLGPLADRYGRKPVLLVSLVLYAIASLCASLSTSFEMMIGVRVLQGMAAAGGRVLVISIVRDCYEGRQMARVMSLSFIVFLAVPILAPGIGQLIILVAPWNTIFDALAAFGIAVALWMAVRLPETLHPAYRRPIGAAPLWAAARLVIGNRYSLGYTLALTLMFGSLMGYVNSAQQLIADRLGAADRFALVFAIMAASMGFSAFINSRVVERLGSRIVSHGALIGFIILVALHALWSYIIGDTLLSFMLFQCATFFFFGFTGSNFNAMAMEPMGAIAGTASSIQGTISTLGAALIGIAIGQHFDGTALPILTGFVLCGLGALIVVFITERGRLFHAHHSAPLPG